MGLLNNTEWRMSRKGPLLMFAICMVATIAGGGFGAAGGTGVAFVSAIVCTGTALGLISLLWGLANTAEVSRTGGVIAGSILLAGALGSLVASTTGAVIFGCVAAPVFLIVLLWSMNR